MLRFTVQAIIISSVLLSTSSGCRKTEVTGFVSAILRNGITGERYSGVTVSFLESFESLGYGGIGEDKVTDAQGVATFKVKLKPGKKYELRFQFYQMISVDESSYEWYADSENKIHIFELHPHGYTRVRLKNNESNPAGDTVWVKYKHQSAPEFYPERVVNYGSQSGSFLEYLDVGPNVFEFRKRSNQGDSIFTVTQTIAEGYTPINQVEVVIN